MTRCRRLIPQRGARRSSFATVSSTILLWHSTNYPDRLAAYARAAQKVAIWISSGDRDPPDILRAVTKLYRRLHVLQPSRTELLLMHGGHDWAAFDAALAPALGYIDSRCR